MATETGVYVYAITRDPPAKLVERTRGVGGASVRAISHEGVTALVSTVDLAEFGEEALRRNLEDLGWLEGTARGHNAVVADAAALAVTLPMRLLTVYRNDARVREALRDRKEEFAEAFDRIGGRGEWGVKAFAELRDLMTDAAAGEDSDAGRPGTSYLLRRRAERHTEEEARQEAMRRATEIDTRLSEIAVARHLHPPQNPELSGHQGLMVLNASYLVDDERVEEFRKAVASLGGLRGISAQLSGPWAPYSFATEEGPWTAR
ncbi:GvpL/GvpF family gas vesicle protein [Actinomadura rugatobispora]|uniref:GvpL/GvpF family gas vesicle protein n=1 Tax=Actinomadura rugatobispora TaxID=1994 RepID=A0ABW1AEW2_9ACTN|nr:GvpL/GvpF family gas vesicle protein [Actinomadura rugatobispora]